MKECNMQYCVIENNPSATPWKIYINNNFKSNPPFCYIDIWVRWCPKDKSESPSDWEHRYELGNNYAEDGCIYGIYKGGLVRVPSKYSWRHFGPFSFADDKYIQKTCKQLGLKYTIFDALYKANQYCMNQGFPRIGAYMNARPDENEFVPLAENEPYIKIYENWGKDSTGEYKCLAKSLDPFPQHKSI